MPERDRAPLRTELEAATLKLLAYCRENNWSGHEPYDASDSKLFHWLPFLNSRLPRLMLTQTLKRLPVNLRPLLLIPKTQNPKAIAIFLSAVLKLVQAHVIADEELVPHLVGRLIALKSADARYWCWGYSFSWQTRVDLVPAGTPNLVCTAFAAHALLDAYDSRHDSQCLSMALGAAQYLAEQLYWADDAGIAGFAYPLPSVRGQTHNANFLAASVLCRVSKATGAAKFLEPALTAARFSASRQHADGSWYYGEAPAQHWIDNFHTAYNLCELRSIAHFAGTDEFDQHIRRGFEFYRANFFRDDGAPKYYHDRPYPLDAHCVAQGIIALLTFRDLNPENTDFARTVFRWAMDHLWDDRGYFYLRKLRFGTNRICYMRWSQAWMLLAMATLLFTPDDALRQVECAPVSMRSGL